MVFTTPAADVTERRRDGSWGSRNGCPQSDNGGQNGGTARRGRRHWGTTARSQRKAGHFRHDIIAQQYDGSEALVQVSDALLRIFSTT